MDHGEILEMISMGGYPKNTGNKVGSFLLEINAHLYAIMEESHEEILEKLGIVRSFRGSGIFGEAM